MGDLGLTVSRVDNVAVAQQMDRRLQAGVLPPTMTTFFPSWGCFRNTSWQVG